ncbi:choice-of-anchor E domain-containing protein [Primorskyibacter sp. 2E107]|uniref:choice-of-anchor E domain-containing protein n=1 Tax=Primorskyibacter sp. 2E107 TaxID=3403458 RepID=UPI003AF9E363
MKSIALAVVVVAGLAAGAAQAATATYSGSVASTSTNWSDSVLLTQFDPLLGTLDSVSLSLTGSVDGDANAESLDGAPAVITLSLSATITASVAGFPGLSVDVNPLSSSIFNATSFDGTIDFGGTSGVSYSGLTASDSDTSVFTSGLSPFIGNGTFSLDLSAVGASSGSGAGNLITQFFTDAGATASVTYNYTPPISEVPLPAGAPLLIGALGGLALVRRRKAKKAA